MTRLYTFPVILFLSLLGCESISVNAQTPDRAQMHQEMTLLRDRLKEIEKQFIPPDSEDRAAYSSFLQQPGTGIMRLLPREKFDGFLAIRGGGAYYSFSRLTNEYGRGSDLSLQQDQLSVGFAGANFGMLTLLGDVALDEVKSDLPAVEYLSAFNTPLKESEARIQQRQVGRGYTINEVAYKDHFPALLNNTYLLRSINYGDSDLLIAFRVVRRDADGSLIILWKLLKKFSVPKLELSNTVAATGS